MKVKVNAYLKLITPNDLDLRPGAVAILIAFVRFSVSEFTDSSPLYSDVLRGSKYAYVL